MYQALIDYQNDLLAQDTSYNAVCTYMDAFATYLDYCSTSSDIKAIQSSYRASFKYKFRSAAHDKIYRSALDKLLYQLHPHPTPCKPLPDEEYLQESLEIFRMRYIHKIPIAKIMTNHNYILSESDIHRRLDYITELIIIRTIGLYYLAPGLDTYLDEFERLSGIKI